MKNQILLSALAIVAIAFSAFTEKKKTSTLGVNTVESKVTWVGKKVTGEHSGTISIAQGDLKFDGDKFIGGFFEIDMNSIKNTDIENEEYNQKIVGHLKSDDFFGAESYPKSSFVIKEVKQKSATKYHVTGEMTIKATTKSLEFPVEISLNGDKAVASASITVDRSEFNIRYRSGSFFDGLGDKMIYDDFTLDVTLVASK